MSNYTKIVDYAAKDALLTGNPSKLVKGTELGAEFDAISTAVATKADSASPTLTGTITAAIANFSGLVTAALGLTVSGGAFNSRGITDSATAKALTLSGSGANSVTIANSATNPTIGTSGGTVALSSGALATSATLGIGYGTGSGGTVTQLTNKATGVTLNKLNGQITMNNALLANGSAVSFVLTNSLLAVTDVVIVNTTATFPGYTISAYPNAGGCLFRIVNISGGDLSESVVVNFAVIKAVTS
mgnify:CR=1 FL=1